MFIIDKAIHIAFGIYFFSVIWFLIGILATKRKKISKSAFTSTVSVIVCVRNGEDSLNKILFDLKNQIYNNKHEFIIVDDESTDQTKAIINRFVDSDSRFVYLSSADGNNKLKNKNRALDVGIKSAKYDLLVFTDVDCRMENQWLNSMVSNYHDKTEFVIGYSRVVAKKSLVSIFQSIDFRMLMFCSLGAASMRTPFGSTGQNQSYRKEVFIKNNGFKQLEGLVQGDDSLFLNICNNHPNFQVKFSIYKESYVIAKTLNSWKDLFSQRMRWAGDAHLMYKFNKVFFIIFLGFFISNIACILAPLIYIYTNIPIIFFMVIKFLIELLLFLFGSYLLNEKIYIHQFVFWFFTQIFYVVVIGLLSPFKFINSWKGRTIN